MRQLKICGYRVDISIETPKTPHSAGECAQMSDSRYEIRILQGLHDREFCETVVHELIECVNMIFDLELPHPTIQTLGASLTEFWPHKIAAPLLKRWIGTKPKKARK